MLPAAANSRKATALVFKQVFESIAISVRKVRHQSGIVLLAVTIVKAATVSISRVKRSIFAFEGIPDCAHRTANFS